MYTVCSLLGRATIVRAAGSFAAHRFLAIAVLICGVVPAGARAEDRSYDGSGNNLDNPLWGATGVRLQRRSMQAYGDGFAGMAGESRLSPRVISNEVVFQASSIPNDRKLSDWVWQWGQFLDHDLDLVVATQPLEPAEIPVPIDDPVFGFPMIPFNRSAYDHETGTGPGNPRQQVNSITSYLDASMVYGSDAVTAAALRSFVGGRVLVTTHATGDLLPLDGGFFLAGDPRVNEQVGLTSVHTLFVREHNRWADLIAAEHPEWNDEQIYQRARKVVGAEIQSITFNEWLPALLGEGTVPAYGGYDEDVDCTVANEFAAALFRVGHTMLSPTLLRLSDDGQVIPAGNLALRDAFFQPQRIMDEGGIDPLLKGLASQVMQEIDAHVVEDVRSFLFTIETGGIDLPSLNIQRGRDHGLPDYNTVRAAYGLAPVASFSAITSDAAVAANLEAVYVDVDDIDVWVGALAEDHLANASVGPLVGAAILDQFLRARAGDRFWYENDAELADTIDEINATRLSDIIRRNSSIATLQSNVFFIPSSEADFDGNGRVDLMDFVTFTLCFGMDVANPTEPCAPGDAALCDFDGSGMVDLSDFTTFAAEFTG